LSLLAVTALVVAGCGESDGATGKNAKSTSTPAAKKSAPDGY
jgi:hypothetical protein